MIRRLSLEKKFLLITIFCVILTIALLATLVVRRESALLQEEHRKNAGFIATLISKALKDNMLAGRIEETKRLLSELSDTRGVDHLSVMKLNGDYAFGTPGPSIMISADLRKKMLKGDDALLSVNGADYLMTPLLNERQCRSCHLDDENIRGVVVVGISSEDVEQNISDFTKRVSAFGFLTAIILSGILVLLSRRMILSPIKGLTDAARQITLGNYALYKPRGSHCDDILACKKSDCPSHGNEVIPCWLQSGTLCDGETTGQFALKFGSCEKCRVYRSRKGDEIVQLQDNFNRMSLSLKKDEEVTRTHIREIEGLNEQLLESNARLNTLLHASRLTNSTLELGQTLSASLKIILDAARIKAGAVFFLQEDVTRRCYEFFRCQEYNCPAHRADMNCWRLPETLCTGGTHMQPDWLTPMEYGGARGVDGFHIQTGDYNDRGAPCGDCAFFSNVRLVLKKVSGFTSGRVGERINISNTLLHKTLLTGQTVLSYSGENPLKIPMDVVTEIAMPLKMQEQILGIVYLASDSARRYGEEEISFLELLAGIISSGIFNSTLFEEVDVSYFQTVIALSNAVDAKDPYTRGHSERVAKASVRAADALGLSKQESKLLRFAAILHDVGKIGVSRDLIRKIRTLDDQEKDEMRAHPDRGVKILEPIHFLEPVLSAIRHHHERFDGSGYPLGLKGKDIPFKARILCVADAWDAMLSDRPYRKALSIDEVKEELRTNAGTQFDPEVVNVFLDFTHPL